MNNTFLHYDLPLEIDKTEVWLENNKDRTDRYDAVIEADGVPVGLIGLLSVDARHKKAEYYVTIGEREYLGRGVAGRASKLLLEYAFSDCLNSVTRERIASFLAPSFSFEKMWRSIKSCFRSSAFSHSANSLLPLEELHFEQQGSKLYISVISPVAFF